VSTQPPSPGAPARRLRIAVLSRHFDGAAGGAERYTVALAEQLAARHEVHVFAQHFGAVLPAGLTLHLMPGAIRRPRWLNQIGFAITSAWAARRGFDIVHSHENTWAGNVQTMHVRSVRVNLFGQRHGLRLALAWLKVLTSPRLLTYVLLEGLRLRARPARRVVAVSEPLRSELLGVYPALEEQGVPVVNPGVDLPAPITPEQRGVLRSELGLAPGQCVLLHVANDHEKKGLPALLQALADLQAPELLLVVVGHARHHAQTQALARKLGVHTQLRLTGPLADPAPWYQGADLLVHPALEDTFGMVVAEALSHALPVIVSASPWCGIAAGLVDGVDAVVLPDPRDVEQLAAAIRALCADAPRRAALGAAGRHHARRYAWPALAERYEAIYTQLVDQAASARLG
jgi:UDP-glucose:(heptosyl)LPS alpha-1,3-glucosyltransferase